MTFPFRAINRTDSTNRRISRAAVIIGLLTLVTKSAAVVKELLAARWNDGYGDRRHEWVLVMPFYAFAAAFDLDS
jgi:hypothetical protein